MIRNPVIQDDVHDLTELSYMHEPAMLHALHLRYDLDMIYSYAGPILIAGQCFQAIKPQLKHYSESLPRDIGLVQQNADGYLRGTSARQAFATYFCDRRRGVSQHANAGQESVYPCLRGVRSVSPFSPSPAFFHSCNCCLRE